MQGADGGLRPTSRSVDAEARDAPAAQATPARRGGIWLNGNVLACACPDCGAPMSIRLWLRLADCWRCGASLELTYEQQQDALRLLGEQPQEPVAAPDETSEPQTAVIPAVAAPLAQTEIPSRRTPWANPMSSDDATRAATIELAPASPPAPPQETATEPTSASSPWRFRWDQLPSWLTSLVLHMLLVILLGLWLLPPEQESIPIELSTQLGPYRQDGDLDDRQGDESEAPQSRALDANAVAISSAPAKDAVEMPEITSLIPPSAGTLAAITADLTSAVSDDPGRLLAGRDPRLRADILAREGGTSLSEAAVARGLKWLAEHQNYDGSWSLDAFDQAGDCNGRCTSPGGPSDHAATALALLPFLGSGQTHWQGDGPYRNVVARGLRWLMDHQKENGDLRGPGNFGRMYAHGQAAIALCEAYAMTRDEALHKPAQKAVDFIVRAQHSRGGWRYAPDEPGDTSVVGWQLMALRSAQMGYLKVPPQTFTKASRFLSSVQTERSRGLFTYMPGGGPTETMTAEGLLSREYSGWKRDDAPLIGGARWLLQNFPPERSRPNMYYWYYATQAMHHLGGPAWQEWNGQLRDLLISMQETEGHEAGSWTPRDGHDMAGGRLYMTALAVCTLEVYYRHLPLYRSTAVDGAVAEK